MADTKENTDTQQDGINLSKRAAQEVQDIMKENEIDSSNAYLRVGVKGGGCSGFGYILDLTEEIKENDEIFDQHGIKIACDSKSLLYLDGVVIDFKDEIMGRGFVFENPNATSSCGCGASFSA